MSERSKGYYIKHSFSNDFVNLMENLYKKYGEEVFEIQGIASRHMDIAQFSRSFFKSSNEAVANLSVDANANVNEKNVTQYTFENNKAIMRLNSLYMVYKLMKENYSKEEAALALEKVINGELFVNDLHTYAHLPYCFAFDLRNLLMNGMNFFEGNMKIQPPKRSDSFIALVIQSTAYISNQIAGAASYPDFFPILDWFYRKEMGNGYLLGDIPKMTEKKIKDHFQNLIYSLNFPFRGGQSAFTNLSVMDKGFMESLFEGYTFPDLSSPDYESTISLSKMFFEYLTEIYSEEGIFTFPVMTLAVSTDEKTGEYLDPDFVNWVAEVNSKKAVANVFQDKPTSFSSCCRLKNSFESTTEVGYQNSFGVGGLSIGSHRVAGFNLPRIALLEKENPNIFEEDLEILHKILLCHRKLLIERIEGGQLPLYTSGWIDLKRQYSTIGFVGGYEYVTNAGYNIHEESGIALLADKLKIIEESIVNWQIEEREAQNIYNVEQIPAESMAVRLADIDHLLGYNDVWELYSNQYVPLIDEASIYDRMRIQGEFDSLTSGGSILHLSSDGEKPLTPAQYKKLMLAAKDSKTVYFAVNYAYSKSSKGVLSIGKHDICPINGDPIVCQYTRVVGFVTPVTSWNKKRRDFEYDRRVFYKNEEI